MGNEMVDERVDEIRAQHEEDQKHIDAGDRDLFDWTDTVEIHAHRAYLLAEVKRLRGCILAEQKETLAAKALERDLNAYDRENAKLRVQLVNAESRLAELLGRLDETANAWYYDPELGHAADVIQTILSDYREKDDE